MSDQHELLDVPFKPILKVDCHPEHFISRCFGVRQGGNVSSEITRDVYAARTRFTIPPNGFINVPLQTAKRYLPRFFRSIWIGDCGCEYQKGSSPGLMFTSHFGLAFHKASYSGCGRTEGIGSRPGPAKILGATRQAAILTRGAR